MRLLHNTRLEFCEFLDDKIPQYAILSHRWGEDEVSYQDFLAGRKRDGAGYAKILHSCSYVANGSTLFRSIRAPPPYEDYQTKSLGLLSKQVEDFYEWVDVEFRAWIWIDTCCIDKSSSTELSEAINSMYRWYKNAHVCLAYLSDFTQVPHGFELENFGFGASTWFARGWTLQELLAPRNIVFLDKDWTPFGTRESLHRQITSATGISQLHMNQSTNEVDKQLSVAERFSWAAHRTTSRGEDQAYCLLGLFQINIPLLYGEGTSAFERLQMEIIRTSNDESILLWERDWNSRNNRRRNGGGYLRTVHINLRTPIDVSQEPSRERSRPSAGPRAQSQIKN